MPIPIPEPLLHPTPTQLPQSTPSAPLPFWHFLEAPWWQGVAGITQIIAGILALITILQAIQMIRKAEKQRRESVAADWEVLDYSSQKTLNGGEKIARVSSSIVLINTGFGNAINLAIENHLDVKKNVSYNHTIANNNTGNINLFIPNDKLIIWFRFSEDQYPVKGYCVIKSLTRFGAQQECKISFILTDATMVVTKDYCKYI